MAGKSHESWQQEVSVWGHDGAQDCCPGWGGGGGGNFHLKEVGILVVSLRGVNFEFWSHLGCSG